MKNTLPPTPVGTSLRCRIFLTDEALSFNLVTVVIRSKISVRDPVIANTNYEMISPRTW